MKNLLLAICFVLGTFGISAQDLVVTGTVTDQTNSPLPGATVQIAKSSRATSTDVNGNYSINVSKGETLTVKMVGYVPAQQVIKKSQTLNIQLKETSQQIAELVVVGYSTQERRDITGAVSSVMLNEEKPFFSVDQLLQGQAPGVYVSTSSGALGGANLLTIRGVSTIMGDNNPLYVVDGVPIYGTDRDNNSQSTSGGSISATAMGGTQIGGGSLEYNTALNNTFESNPLTSLNPDDIESIEILKDAFATAIYGSRGAAGVVLITTKKGSKDKTKVNITYSLSVDRVLGKQKLLSGAEYNTIYSMYYPKGTFNSPYNTDWQDAVTRTAISNNLNASVSGGNGRTNYFVSLAFANNESYVIGQDLSRYSARANLDTKLTDKWTMGVNMSIAKVDNKAMQANQIYKVALLKAPNLPIYDEFGKYYYGYKPNSVGYDDAYNPVAQAYNDTQKNENMRVIGNIFLEFKPFSWLTLRSELGTDISNTYSYVKKVELPDVVENVPNNQATESNNNNYRVVNNNTINLNKIFGDHFLQGVLGQSYEISHEKYTNVSGSDFYSPDLIGVDAAQNKRVLGSNQRKWALFSAFVRANYQYKQRYMAGVTYRVDGSSRYNRDHRYLSIPSFSLGWRISEEPFVKKNIDWIDDLKLRGSVGWSSKDGNNSYYGAQATYVLSSLNYGNNSFINMSQPGNVDLTWERTITYDLGLDLSIIQNRLKATLDYYYKKTTNMLFPSDLPLYTGFQKQNQNIADLQNTGIELQVISTNIVKPNFMWQTILNVSHSSNKLLKLNFSGNQLDQLNSNFKYYEVGKPLSQWYLYQWAGINPNNGNPQWLLLDGTITEVAPASNTSSNNKRVMGTATPKFYGGLTNTFTYRGIELSCLFTFSVGGRMINSTRAYLLTYATNKAYNLSSDMMNMWQVPGQITDIPKLNNASIVNGYDYTTAITSTRFLEKSDYLRLKTLELSYTFPHSILRKTRFLSNAKVFATATNVFTITPYSGVDPEVSAFGSSAVSSGYDNLTMPQSRSYQFGVRLGF